MKMFFCKQLTFLSVDCAIFVVAFFSGIFALTQNRIVMQKPHYRSYGPLRFLLMGLISATLFLMGCLKEDDITNLKNIQLPTYNPTIAVPLGSATLSLNDLLNQVGDVDLLYVDQDGMLRVYYRSKLLSEYAGDLIEFDTQQADTTVNLMFPVSLPAGDSITISHMFNQQFFNVQGDIVDSIRWKDGTLTIEVESMMDHNGRIVVTSPHIMKNNVPLRQSFDLTYTGTLPVQQSVNINLNGYSFHPDHSAGSNDLHYYMDFTLIGDNNPDPGPYPISVNIEMDDLKYRVLFGQIANRSMAILSDEIEIPMFETSSSGSFWVNDPRIGIHFSNSFGIPIAVNLDPLRGVSDVNPPYIVDLFGPGLPTPFILNSPTIAELGQRAKSSIFLDKNNTNIDDFLNLLPSSVEYGIEGTINPAGATPGNFVMDTSYFEVEVEIEIPLEGYASGFTLQDTLAFTLFGDSEDGPEDMIDWILFRVNGESTFPFDARVQVYFLDSNQVMVDSLFEKLTKVIPGALPGPPPHYNPLQPSYASFDIKADNAKIKRLNERVGYMVLSGTIDTSGGGNQVVRIRSDNYLKLEMGVQSKVRLDPNDM